jgi:hypothetical protein
MEHGGGGREGLANTQIELNNNSESTGGIGERGREEDDESDPFVYVRWSGHGWTSLK